MARHPELLISEARKAQEAQRRNSMWYVYILRSRNDGKLYVGSTNDLKRRLREHQEGRCAATAHRRPLEIEAYVAVNADSVARELEDYFKSGSGIATLRKRILTSQVRRA